jgi:hypothetical protein
MTKTKKTTTNERIEPHVLFPQEWKKLKAIPQVKEIIEELEVTEIQGKKYLYPKVSGKEVIMYTLNLFGTQEHFIMIKKIGGVWQLNED